jgi:hypothetical protein
MKIAATVSLGKSPDGSRALLPARGESQAERVELYGRSLVEMTKRDDDGEIIPQTMELSCSHSRDDEADLVLR